MKYAPLTGILKIAPFLLMSCITLIHPTWAKKTAAEEQAEERRTTMASASTSSSAPSSSELQVSDPYFYLFPVYLTVKYFQDDLTYLKYLVNKAPQGPQILEQRETDGTTLAHEAAAKGEVRILKYVVENVPMGTGILETRDHSGVSVAERAAKNEQFYTLLYIAHHAPSGPKVLEERVSTGETLLHISFKPPRGNFINETALKIFAELAPRTFNMHDVFYEDETSRFSGSFLDMLLLRKYLDIFEFLATFPTRHIIFESIEKHGDLYQAAFPAFKEWLDKLICLEELKEKMAVAQEIQILELSSREIQEKLARLNRPSRHATSEENWEAKRSALEEIHKQTRGTLQPLIDELKILKVRVALQLSQAKKGTVEEIVVLKMQEENGPSPSSE